MEINVTIISSTEINKEIINKIKWDPYYEKVEKEKCRTMVKCSICVKYKSTVLLHATQKIICYLFVLS